MPWDGVPWTKSRYNAYVEAASGQLQSVSQQLPGGPNGSPAAPASNVGVSQPCLPVEECGYPECCSSLCTYSVACVIKVKVSEMYFVLTMVTHICVCQEMRRSRRTPRA